MMMKTAVVLLLLLVAVPSSLGHKTETEVPTAVTKVVNMLKEMQAQLKKESEGDEEAYDKMQCYCVSNEAEKSAAIASAETRSAELTHMIEEMTAKHASLTEEVSQLNAEIAEENDGLAKSTEIRGKDKKDFREEEKNMIVSISGLKTAVMVLGQANDYSAAALDQESLLSVKSALRRVSSKSMESMLSQEQLHSVRSLMSAKKQARSFLETGEGQPQSGAIFGIMKQMKEEFEGNLATSTTDEAQAQKDYESLKAGKNEEIAAATDKAETKTAEAADAKEAAANGKRDLADTQATLATDTEFLANLREMCGNLDKEFAERTKTRTMEVAAISEAIGILTDDDAHDLFNKSLGFVQLSAQRASVRQLAAAKVLSAGKAAKDPKLSLLALSMKIDAFGQVREKVQKMIDDLKAQKAEEIKTKDECNTNIYENEVATTAKGRDKDDLENTIANLEAAKVNLGDEVKALKAESAAMHVDIKAASENREEESKEFQTTISEQKATQEILQRALDRLKEFYAKKAAALIQQQKQNPGSFAPYKKNEAAGGVLAMIENVIDDSKELEAEATKGEQDAQAAYETFVNDSDASLKAMATEIASKTAEAGTTDENLANAKADLKAAKGELESLTNINKQLHWDCDFMVKNFAVRQQSIDGEVQALEASIAMLSGAK